MDWDNNKGRVLGSGTREQEAGQAAKAVVCTAEG